MSAIVNVNAEKFEPILDRVFVTNMDSGEKRTRHGLIVTDDDMTNRGIRARWAQVYAVGPDVADLTIGEWILIEHGRWSNRIDMTVGGEEVQVWRVEYPKSVLVACDTDPREEMLMVPDPKLYFNIDKKTW